MKIIMGSENKLGILQMQHNGEILEWNCTGFEHQTLMEPEGVFRDLNGLWASMPEDHQEKIWDTYCQINDALHNIVDIKRLRERLTPLTRDLFELHPYDLVEHWIKFRSHIVYPDSLMDSYSVQHPKETTYLRKDYVDLAVLVLSLRIMVPVWGVFTRILKPFAARQRERLAVTLLASSPIIQSPPYLMLREHIERLKDKHLLKNPVPLSAKADCIGTETVGETIFCISLVRRVTMGELSQKNTNLNIVSTVHQHVKTQLEGLDKSSGGRISEKHTPNDREEDNASRAESYKARTEVTPGSVATDQVFIENLNRLATTVEPNLSQEKLAKCLASAKRCRSNGQYQATPHQIAFTQYILSNVVSPRSLEYPDLDQIFNSMVVTQAVLWDWGFPQLAALMFVSAYEFDDTQMLERRRFSSVSKELREELHKLYPYYEFNNQENRGRNDCFAIKAINLFLADLQAAAWVASGPDEVLVEANKMPFSQRLEYNSDGEIVLPVDFADVMAQFIIRLNKR